MKKTGATPGNITLDVLSAGLYRDFLEQALAKEFTFYRVKDHNLLNQKSRKNIILRHDIDLSLEHAHAMASLEVSYGIRSTYYVMINGEFYNILDKKKSELLKKIHKMGHEIGLHFGYYSYGFDSIDRTLEYQARILEAIIEDKIVSYSQHDPVNKGYSKSQVLFDAYQIAAFPHTEYVSDSGMKWRDYDFFKALELGKNLYLLAHPVSWMSEKNDLISIIREVEQKEIRALEERYENFVKGHLDYYKKREQEGL